MACETETVTLPVTYYIEAEIQSVTGPQRFGPVCERDKAEQLLVTLAGRSNVTKATLIREVPS